jgi:hypothetical protein
MRDYELLDPGANFCPYCGERRDVCGCDVYPIRLPWWINDPLVTMTDGAKCIDNVRENSALYRVMIANGWTEVKS